MSDLSPNLERCLRCKHAAEPNRQNGTLICRRYSMLIDDKVDEIPDDCVEFEPQQTTAEGAPAAQKPQ
jgi:hypothetical protein